MKPFVVYIKPNKNDNIILTKDEFEQYLQEAYDKGYTDGKAVGGVTITSSPITPLTTPGTPLNPWYTYPNITCDTAHPKTCELNKGTGITLHS